MARPVPFPEQNDTLGSNEPGVIPLPCYRDPNQVISLWKLTPEELLEVAATGCIWLQVMGTNHPPLYIAGNYPFEKVKN